jgi:hypothetical protein
MECGVSWPVFYIETSFRLKGCGKWLEMPDVLPPTVGDILSGVLNRVLTFETDVHLMISSEALPFFMLCVVAGSPPSIKVSA